MSLFGNLSTMPITDLLQWLATAGKTGTLQVERNKIAKWIVVRDGRIVGCSSDDPPQRLGQYLLSREKITEDNLRDALTLQSGSGKHLGRILVEMGVIDPQDLTDHLDSKAEETIYSLFDWDDGVFRYKEEIAERENLFTVDLQVQDILLRGLKRYDEMKRIRDALGDPGLVLGYTSRPPGPEIFADRISRAMYSAIDGDRTIAEILLQVHGSEYQVYSFLYDLHCKGYVEIIGQRAIGPTTSEVPAIEAATPAARPSTADDVSPVATATAAAVATPAAPPAAADPFESRLTTARELMTECKYEEALEILDVLYRRHPEDDALRRLTAEAEAAFIDRAYRHLVPPDRVPVLLKPMEDLATEALSPQEFFLLSRIDGAWDVRSIIQVAPLREVDALRTLKRMREIGMIELRESK